MLLLQPGPPPGHEPGSDPITDSSHIRESGTERKEVEKGGKIRSGAKWCKVVYDFFMMEGASLRRQEGEGKGKSCI